MPVTINFLQGEVENNAWDTFQVFDGAVGGPILLQNGGVNLNVAGASVTASVGNPITILFDSDGSVSCASGSFVNMVFEVFCGGSEVPGCTDPGADNYDPSATIDDGSCFTLNCGGNIISGTYCYSNGDNTFFSYAPATPGDQVLLAFSQGEIESAIFDQIIVYDGAGPGSPILYQNAVGGATDLSGLDFLSTLGNGISFSITSDGSISCGAGTYLQMEWEVYCAIPPVFGCTNPLAANYDPDATVDDGSCAACFSTDPNGCPQIDAGADIVIPECSDPCVGVSVQADVFMSGSTETYGVCQIPFAPPYPITGGTGFSIGVDDVYTPEINLPFDFCFFGQVYDRLVVGSNGVLSFDLANAGAYCPYAFTANCPSPALPRNAIFGVYHDIDPQVCGDATYAVLGTSPCRVFVVNFEDVCHFSCNALTSTTQIVLYETTNVIEVHVANKPTCPGWNSGNALIGIQDQAGTLGFVPTTRQTGPWTVNNESWRFTPAGAPNYEVNWYDQSNGLIGTGVDVEVCPSETIQSYVAEATYTKCDGTEVVVSDIVSVSCAMIMLPVEWLGFDAKLISQNEEVLCSWQTATELENDYFTVQRSPDGELWEDIGFVDGAGTSYEEHSYHFVDSTPYSGTSYYRIKQTDFNGETDHTHRAVIMREELALFAAYPNPSDGKLRLTGTDGGVLQVLDLRGRVVEEFISFDQEIELSPKAEGAYLLKYISRKGELSYQRIQVY